MKNLIKAPIVSVVTLTLLLGSTGLAIGGPKHPSYGSGGTSFNKSYAPTSKTRLAPQRINRYAQIGKVSTGPAMPVSNTPKPPKNDGKPTHFMGAAFTILSAGVSIGLLAHKVANPSWETDGGSLETPDGPQGGGGELADPDGPQGGGGSLGGAGSGLQY
ncbi:MAG: hypothetical protein NPINA01_02680 [Nitrospinaceae bacterium]|nr:MAG: hypothetical protein NPINA01_02680 [Nitrospinaceae bacterium]